MKVCSKQCDQCLFTSNRIVSKGRAAQLIKDTLRKDTEFECHKGTIAGQHIVCRGWFDRYPTQNIRIAGRLGVIKYVDPESLTDKK